MKQSANRNYATIILSGVLFLSFGIELSLGAIGNDPILLRLGALSDTGNLNGEYFRLLTYSLLHANYVHFVLNVGLLFWIGGIVERRLRATFMLSIYTVAVLMGGIAIVLWKSYHSTLGVTVGASAGVYGLLAASLILVHSQEEVGHARSSLVRILLWLLLLVGVVTSFLPGVSFVGHAAGLVSGFLLGLIFLGKSRNETQNQQLIDETK